MHGTFHQDWEQIARERTAEYTRRAARQQLNRRLQGTENTTLGKSIVKLFCTLRAHFSPKQRTRIATPQPVTQPLSGEHGLTETG